MHHPGEIRVQQRADVFADDWGSAGVDNTIPPIAEDFLSQQRFLVLAANSRGRPWATAVSGPAGFLNTHDDSTIHVHARPDRPDPLADAFTRPRQVGLIAVDPATRRRMRLNGKARSVDSGLVVETDQVYANCPKYIQTRTVADAERPARSARYGKLLTHAQQEWVHSSDTMFVATSAPGLGVDASHRGGNPGFVQVRSQKALTWPDYVGNSMYMTLGNLDMDPRAGLLFIDWSDGHTLHLTGRARTDWDPERAAAFPGAQRVIDFEVDEVVQIDHHLPLTWTLEKYSRFNPPLEQRS